MSRDLLRQYRRPDGTIREDVLVSQLQEDFLQADPALWNSGTGYAEIMVNMFSDDESYLVFSYNAKIGYYCEAHMRIRGASLSTQCPKTSDDLSESASVWDGQMHFHAPAAFFVSREQASDIASHFWLSGQLWQEVKWVDPRHFGWDLT
jgi:hypothetical protein